MASPEADFESLRICADDYNNLLFKIRYIERLMFLRKNDLPFALKFISYLILHLKLDFSRGSKRTNYTSGGQNIIRAKYFSYS